MPLKNSPSVFFLRSSLAVILYNILVNFNLVTIFLLIFLTTNIFMIKSSRIANKVRKFILKDKCDDTGCSLKIFDKKIFLNLPYFNGLHRFLPALFSGLGYETQYVPVNHRHRISGISKYGVYNRLFRGIRDIIKVKIILYKHKSKND